MKGVMESSSTFLRYLDDFIAGLQTAGWNDVLADSAHTAILAVDVINGFCCEGNLASPRIAAIVPPIVRLFEQAHARGVRQFVLIQEWHSEHAEEFKAFAPHAVRGTKEAQTVAELAALPFANTFTIMRKNSVSPVAGTGLDAWLEAHPLETAIIVGDCTDICAYLLAMHLRTRANARDQKLRIVVPANCVETYDLPVETARQIGAMPHDGDLLHAVFLYHMALNGIEIVKEIAE